MTAPPGDRDAIWQAQLAERDAQSATLSAENVAKMAAFYSERDALSATLRSERDALSKARAREANMRTQIAGLGEQVGKLSAEVTSSREERAQLLAQWDVVRCERDALLLCVPSAACPSHDGAPDEAGADSYAGAALREEARGKKPSNFSPGNLLPPGDPWSLDPISDWLVDAGKTFSSAFSAEARREGDALVEKDR